MAEDLRGLERARGHALSGCNLHKRVYTFERQYGFGELESMSFASLAGADRPPERIKHFLDPWNSPYCLRDHSGEASRRREVFLNSFGPNHRRDSSTRRVRGDDIGEYLMRPRSR